MSITIGTIFNRLKKEGVIKPGRILDLGCGPGIDAVNFASNDFIVDAVDADQEALKQIPSSTLINPILSRIEDFKVEENTYQMVSCQYVLHFLRKNIAHEIIQKMVQGAVAGGVISFCLLGEKDEWNTKWTTWTRGEAEEFISSLPITLHKVITEEGMGMTKAGTMKYWHVLNFVLIKR